MQHNTWGKDRNDLASLASKVITESYEDGEVDMDAEFFKKYDRLPESKQEEDDFKAEYEASKSKDGENPESESDYDDLEDIDQRAREIEEAIGLIGEFEGVAMGRFFERLTELALKDPDLRTTQVPGMLERIVQELDY